MKISYVKRILPVFIAVAVTVLSGCGSRDADASARDKIRIVTTIFPEYDWVNNILGDNPAGAEVTLLLDNGVDLHSYQPTVNDIMQISDCDLLIYVGGESDEWIDDALEEAVNKKMVTVNLLDCLGEAVKTEETVEGMISSDDEEEPDEHVWLSLKCAAILTRKIEAAIESIDSGNAGVYKNNAEIYIEKLEAMDSLYEKSVAAGAGRTLLFGSRFPFRYMTDDYDLNYYAAFAGCSAETGASFEVISFLANKIDEKKLRYVLTVDGDDPKIAQTIADSARTPNVGILTMDSMQSVTSRDIDSGATYLSIMEYNLSVINEALK